jgi:hypothetical protein
VLVILAGFACRKAGVEGVDEEGFSPAVEEKF